MSIVFFDFKYALKQHEKILEISGGFPGYKDKEYLQTIIDHVKNNSYYPTFSAKLAYVVFSISTGHIFNDGNKRTAIALGSYLLELNGLGGNVGSFIVHMEYLVIWLVERKISRSTFNRAVESIVLTGDLGESVQLETLRELSDEA